MWDVAKHVLEMGGDVILDYGCWARVERDDYRNRAKELGADFKLHYMDVPYSELYRRFEGRNRNLPEGAFEIPKTEMDRYITIFQPPTGDELVKELHLICKRSRLTHGGQSSVAAMLLNQMFLSSNCARMRAIAEADTLLLTVPNQLGVAYNVHVMEAILTTVAPGLGWR